MSRSSAQATGLVRTSFGTATATLFALLCAQPIAHAQASPPVCTSPTVTPSQGIHHVASHPSADQLQATVSAASQDPSVLAGVEPANFGLARYRLQDYADCTGNGGCYWADLDAQTRRAEKELDRLLAEHHAAKPAEATAQRLALILDIDDTSLSSYCEEKREDYGFIPGMFNQWVVSAGAALPVPGTLRLFRHARAAGVTVFFITGRPDAQTAATAANLRSAGFEGWKELILRSAAERDLPTITYKSSERAKIVQAGYTLLMSVGDQWSDLLGAPKAKLSIKLPNPFYYLP